jgi:hypothetical protein
MKQPTKVILTTLWIFLILFSLTPMVSKYSGCIGGGPEFGCVGGTTRSIEFPVYRTAVCLMWHNPGCAPNTLLPGWYDQLLNYENLLIIILLILISKSIALKITSR